MNTSAPEFSIVIPAFNEEAYIKRCLESVLKIDYPKDKFSVYVIDNGSSDNTFEIAKQFTDVEVRKKLGGHVGSVRNYGASLSSARYLAFLDSDCIVPESWLIDAADVLQNNAVGAVGGGYLAQEDGGWVETAWVVEQHIPQLEVKSLAGGCFIVRRELFDAIEGFNEQLGAGEDDELTQRIIKQGFKVLSLRRLAVVHLGYPKSLRDIIKRQIWHGSSQLYSAENLYDPMLLLTHLVLLGLIASVFMALNGAFFSAFATAVISLVLPSILAFYKKSAKRGLSKIGLNKSIQMIFIYTAFFTGRSYGLLKNYIYLVTKRISTRAEGAL